MQSIRLTPSLFFSPVGRSRSKEKKATQLHNLFEAFEQKLKKKTDKPSSRQANKQSEEKRKEKCWKDWRRYCLKNSIPNWFESTDTLTWAAHPHPLCVHRKTRHKSDKLTSVNPRQSSYSLQSQSQLSPVKTPPLLISLQWELSNLKASSLVVFSRLQ